MVNLLLHRLLKAQGQSLGKRSEGFLDMYRELVPFKIQTLSNPKPAYKTLRHDPSSVANSLFKFRNNISSVSMQVNCIFNPNSSSYTSNNPFNSSDIKSSRAFVNCSRQVFGIGQTACSTGPLNSSLLVPYVE